MKILALILALTALGMSSGLAGETIWVGLYHAVNTPPPAAATLAPEKLGHRLQTVFGFKHYVLIKAENLELSQKWQQWSVPRKDYFIRVEPLPKKANEPDLVYYEIYKDAFLVAKGKFEPRKGTPLFVHGPDYQQGILVFVLEAK